MAGRRDFLYGTIAAEIQVPIGELVAWITALLSALASVLAWGARLLWGKEFAAAKDETIKAKEAQLGTKDETIKAKDAQIAGLTQRLEQERELNPMKIREYFKYMKEQLEEYNNLLQGKLEEAQAKLGQLQTDIETERSTAVGRQDQIGKLVAERDKLQLYAAALKKQVDQLQTKQSESANVLFNYDNLLTPLYTAKSYDLGSTKWITEAAPFDTSKISEFLIRPWVTGPKPTEPKATEPKPAQPKTEPSRPPDARTGRKEPERPPKPSS